MKQHSSVQQTTEEICKDIVSEQVDKVVDMQSAPRTKRKFEDNDSDVDLEKEMVKDNNEYKRKIKLGRKVYKILGRTDIEQGSLTLDRKEALDIYMAHNGQNIADQHSLEITTTNQRKINTTIKKKKRKEKTEAVRKAKHLKLEEIKLSEVLSQGTTFHRQMSGVAQQTFLIQNNTMNTNNSAVVTQQEPPQHSLQV